MPLFLNWSAQYISCGETKAWHFQFTSIVEIDRSVPFVELLVPGKSRQRSTPMTAWRTQRLSAPSVCKATLVATVTYVVAHLIIMLTIWLVSAVSVLINCLCRLSVPPTTISTISNLLKLFIFWSILCQVELSRFSTVSYANLPMTLSRNIVFFPATNSYNWFWRSGYYINKKWKYFNKCYRWRNIRR